jgi:hypothetical protein
MLIIIKCGIIKYLQNVTWYRILRPQAFLRESCLILKHRRLRICMTEILIYKI